MGVEINLTLGAAFLAGVLSFFSPCILPLLPVFVSQLSASVGGRDGGQVKSGWSVSLQAFIFVCGFSVIFIALGMASSFLGQFLAFNRYWLMKIGGALVVLMGLNLMGLLRLNLFARHWAPLEGLRPRSSFRSFFLGAAFGLGWTPCIGPVLASILALAATTNSLNTGTLLLAVYSLGLAIPFLILSVTFDRAPGLQAALRRYSRASLLISGVLLIGLGLLMFFDRLQVLAAYLYGL